MLLGYSVMNFQQMYKDFQVSLLFLQHTYIPQVGGFRSLTELLITLQNSYYLLRWWRHIYKLISVLEVEFSYETPLFVYIYLNLTAFGEAVPLELCELNVRNSKIIVLRGLTV